MVSSSALYFRGMRLCFFHPPEENLLIEKGYSDDYRGLLTNIKHVIKETGLKLVWLVSYTTV